MSTTDVTGDKWEFQQDSSSEWRWTRRAPNGEVVGAAHEGYKNRGDCEKNALRNGWDGLVHIDQLTPTLKPEPPK